MPFDRTGQSAFVNVAASQTDSSVVAKGDPGRRIRVLGFVINQGDTTASPVTFNSKPSGAGTAISPAFKSAANGTIAVISPGPALFSTNAGEGLTVTTGAGSISGILVIYTIST